MNALTQPDSPQAALAAIGEQLQRARDLLQRTLEFVRDQALPWSGSGLSKASDDPYVISRFGDLQAAIAAAEALAAAGNAEFELTGQRTPQPQALQDPLRWKYQLIGNYRLNGVLPQGFRSAV